MTLVALIAVTVWSPSYSNNVLPSTVIVSPTSRPKGTAPARFNTVVGEKIVAQGIPVVGAVGGATVNVLFIDHFQDMARGHFTVRRLERIYGPDEVRTRYALLLSEMESAQASDRSPS